MKSGPAKACPCGSGKPLQTCCGRHHAGDPAPTPEALMRSRYAAFALGNAPYLLATWHASTRPPALDLQAEPPAKWIGLEIRATAMQDAEHGSVEFVARQRIGGRAFRLHEHSRFVREDGRWYYLDGNVRN